MAFGMFSAVLPNVLIIGMDHHEIIRQVVRFVNPEIDISENKLVNVLGILVALLVLINGSVGSGVSDQFPGIRIICSV